MQKNQLALFQAEPLAKEHPYELTISNVCRPTADWVTVHIGQDAIDGNLFKVGIQVQRLLFTHVVGDEAAECIERRRL